MPTTKPPRCATWGGPWLCTTWRAHVHAPPCAQVHEVGRLMAANEALRKGLVDAQADANDTMASQVDTGALQ